MEVGWLGSTPNMFLGYEDLLKGLTSDWGQALQ